MGLFQYTFAAGVYFFVLFIGISVTFFRVHA